MPGIQSWPVTASALHLEALVAAHQIPVVLVGTLLAHYPQQSRWKCHPPIHQWRLWGIAP